MLWKHVFTREDHIQEVHVSYNGNDIYDYCDCDDYDFSQSVSSGKS